VIAAFCVVLLIAMAQALSKTWLPKRVLPSPAH